ncbi:A-kinase anchor protein 14 [Brienomyrus brachyistius]|uniref:A-kinase anchor protein 14 n=1 Tax=Brienomyrus brachyistius TaxID=42636 RepID=UPI0020B4124B|nr:A-kinase anchor protein 14 [Brienomyrus brachyistius]
MENNSLKRVDASENVRYIIDNASSLTESEHAGKESIYEIKNINWTTCEDFTIEIGKEQIKEYIGTWELHASWLCSIEFQELKDIESHKEYHYRIRWSIPTWCTPIPKATVCVYFVIEISKVKPQSLPVEVYYLVESNRLRHRPGKTRFREKWLKDVIESKLLYHTVSF